MTNKRNRNWCFTLNNPKKELDLSAAKYAVWQLERGEGGTDHYQGYLEFSTMKSMAQVKEIIGGNPHVETRKGNRSQARDYCMKEEGRVDGPWEHGEYKAQGHRTDLDELAADLKKRTFQEFAQEHPGAVIRYSKGLKVLKTVYNHMDRGNLFRQPEIMIFWGDTGTGKTRKAYEIDPDLYKVPCHEGNVLWFDGYDNQETILLDEFYGGVKYSYFLKLLDGYPLDVQYKGGFVRLNHKRLIITSNKPWQDWYKNVDDTRAMARRINQYAEIEEFIAPIETEEICLNTPE